MARIDLIFEGGGAKGIVFLGALRKLAETGHIPGRLLGTSAGAIVATLLAAGYTVAELIAAVAAKDETGKTILSSFLGMPREPSKEAVRKSTVRTLLRELDLLLIPDFVENRIDDYLAQGLAKHPHFRHLYSFIEEGGWYSADAFLPWLKRKLNEGTVHGTPRRFGEMTLAQFHRATGKHMTLIASDTTNAEMLVLNHVTAPDCPLVWAVRMSMSIPLLWQEVIWVEEWGKYRGRSLTGHVIVDGGILSNFPIALFLAPHPNVREIMGERTSDLVLGLLIDDDLPVPQPARRGLFSSIQEIDPMELQPVQRITRLVNTMINAHDRMSIQVFAEHVVRLPAAGYGTTEFDMSEVRRSALIDAGYAAMEAYMGQRAGLLVTTRGAARPAPVATVDLANRVALAILE